MCCSEEKAAVFKKNVLRRLYGDPEELETQHNQNTKMCASDAGEVKATTDLTCRVAVHKKKVYTVQPPPQGYIANSASVSAGTSDFIREDENNSTDSESEEEVRKRRRRKRKKISLTTDETPELKNSERTSKDSSISTLTKNQKRKLKKKKRRERDKIDKSEENRAFTYSGDTGVDRCT